MAILNLLFSLTKTFLDLHKDITNHRPEITIPAVKCGGGSIIFSITLDILVASLINPLFTQSLAFSGQPPLGRVTIVLYSSSSLIMDLISLCGLFKVLDFFFFFDLTLIDNFPELCLGLILITTGLHDDVCVGMFSL